MISSTPPPLLVAHNVLETQAGAASNIQLNQGEVLGVYGPSGGGKSVLLKKIADLVPHTGSLACQGRAQQDWRPGQWRSQVMLFAAETAWWHETVAEHFEPSINQAWLSAALSQLHLAPALLHQPVSQLSSGEKQRLALIRGVYYQPAVLLLDEVTANLDPDTTVAVEQWLWTYLETQRAGAIWVTHDADQRQRVATHTLKVG